MNLGWVDAVVLIASVLLAILIGLRMRGKTSSVEAYLLGDRNLPWWAILGSIVATETSTATVLSVPGQGFGPTGMRFLQIAFGLVCGRAVVVLVLLPLFFDGKLNSAYEVLDRRFGHTTKYAASALFLVTRNIGDGLRLYLAAVVLEQLVGWSFSASAIAIGGITIFYTYFGGMRSVVWNDCIQLVIYMLGGVATVFIIANLTPGGWETIWNYAADHDKLTVLQWKPSSDTLGAAGEPWGLLESARWLLSEPMTFWSGLIGGAVLTLGTHGTDQMMVQRYLSARSRKAAGIAIFLSGIVVLVQFSLFLFIGVQLACFYATVDPVAVNPVAAGLVAQADVTSEVSQVAVLKPDEVYAHFIIHSFPKNTGLVGLMLAAILAAAMSTLSSSLNASASALVNDFYLPIFGREQSPNSLLSTTRRVAFGFGVLQVFVGLWASTLEKTVISNALTIAGFSAGLLLGLFALGVFNRRATQAAALTGAAVGLCVLLTAQFVAPRYDFPVAWTWFALLGSSATYIAGSCVARLIPHLRSVSRSS
jgi:solute:Na+ symporter, SSS family